MDNHQAGGPSTASRTSLPTRWQRKFLVYQARRFGPQAQLREHGTAGGCG